MSILNQIPGLFAGLDRGLGAIGNEAQYLGGAIMRGDIPYDLSKPKTKKTKFPVAGDKEAHPNYVPAAEDPRSPLFQGAPDLAERAHIEEASRLTQQKDPYMGQAYGHLSPTVNPNVAFGKPMPERDYADEKGGLMGKLNQMEEDNLKRMGYGMSPGMTNLGQSVMGGAAATNATQLAETQEAAGLLQDPNPVSENYTGFPGRQPVSQGIEDGISLDGANALLGRLEQSRNNPNRAFRGNSPIIGVDPEDYAIGVRSQNSFPVR